MFSVGCKFIRRVYSSSQQAIRLDLNNRRTSFSRKSTAELLRAYAVLYLSSRRSVVNLGDRFTQVGKQLLGNALFEKTMKKTFYGQFVAGDTEKHVRDVAADMATRKLRLLLLMVDEVSLDELSISNAQLAQIGAPKFSALIKLTHELGNESAVQFRMSAFVTPQLLAKLSSVLEQLQVPSEKSNLYLLAKLAMESTPGAVDELQKHLIARGVSKSLLNGFEISLTSLGALARELKQRNVRLLVDGELDCMNPGILMLASAMMLIANNAGRSLIFGTYQAYLKTTEARLSYDADFVSKQNGAAFALKLVRGAYMETERAMANNGQSPVWDTYEATNANYDKLLGQLLSNVGQNIKEKSLHPGAVIAATHNIESIEKALGSQHGHLFSSHSDSAMFGQTWGFTDYISEALASNGYAVYQSVAYGTVKAALPFLVRRAQENFSMLARGAVDRAAIRKEVIRRIGGRRS